MFSEAATTWWPSGREYSKPYHHRQRRVGTAACARPLTHLGPIGWQKIQTSRQLSTQLHATIFRATRPSSRDGTCAGMLQPIEKTD